MYIHTHWEHLFDIWLRSSSIPRFECSTEGVFEDPSIGDHGRDALEVVDVSLVSPWRMTTAYSSHQCLQFNQEVYTIYLRKEQALGAWAAIEYYDQMWRTVRCQSQGLVYDKQSKSRSECKSRSKEINHFYFLLLLYFLRLRSANENIIGQCYKYFKKSLIYITSLHRKIKIIKPR